MFCNVLEFIYDIHNPLVFFEAREMARLGIVLLGRVLSLNNSERAWLESDYQVDWAFIYIQTKHIHRSTNAVSRRRHAQNT